MHKETEIRSLYEQDQEDRKRYPLDWKFIGERDLERRARVQSLLEGGLIQAAEDYFYAAVIFMHGLEPVDYAAARDFAQRAIDLNPSFSAAKEMLAAAQDRYLLSIGKSQWYGTQKRVEKGRVVLAPIDPEAVTDEERRNFGVLTLEQREAEIRQINSCLRDKAKASGAVM